MTLAEAIKCLVEEKGVSILTSPMALNILSDYKAFSGLPSSKNILKNVISEGFLEKIVFFYDNQLPLGDAPLNYLSEMYMKLGFRKDVTTYVLNSIFQALNFDAASLLEVVKSEDDGLNTLTTTSTSEDNHIKFHGISLSLTREKICEELEKKGFTVIERTSKLIELKGSFIDIEDVEVRLFGRPNGLVADVSVNIESSMFCLYQINEEHVLSLLTKKYGTLDKAIRNYYDCDEFSGMLLFNKIDDTKTEALDYMWSIPGGYIQVTNVIGNLRIDYIDEVNKEVNQKETEKLNYNSL